MEYHIDIDDKNNILSKFEQLYQGKTVFFDEEDLPISKKITNMLNIKCCPNYMKPENLRSDESGGEKFGLEAGVSISRFNFYSFIQNSEFQTFTIITNHYEYKCNCYGVYSSKYIRKLILQDPTTNQYKYDFDDDDKVFQQICDLFNFKSFTISLNNMDTLKIIAKDLQIDLILPFIDKYIEEYEKVTNTIDEQQNTIDSIENLFNLLYNIDSLTVDSVKSSILNSNWIVTEDSIHELAAFIIQVISSQFKLHPYLFNLIIKLDKEADETNHLQILIPFICKMLLLSNKMNSPVCSFIYNLYKREMISKEDLLNSIISNRNENVINWFLPEIIEASIYIPNNTNFMKLYYPDKIDLYKKMRDSGEPEDELTRLLRNDDVDNVQLILSRNNVDLNSYKLPYNIFENFANSDEMTLINYAAAYGSIKCFKYLMLNHSNLDNSTFSYAVQGGNVEIIRIIHQNIDSIKEQEKKPKNWKSSFDFAFPSFKTTGNENLIKNIFGKSSFIGDILPAIVNHRNDLFDWILEQKYMKNLDMISNDLLLGSAQNGNVYALITVIDKCENTCNYTELIRNSSKFGFYKSANLIFDIQAKRQNNLKFQRRNSDSTGHDFVYFSNLSIFKLGLKIFLNNNNKDNEELECDMEFCVENEFTNIFNYFFDDILPKNPNLLTKDLFLVVGKAAIECKSDYFFNHIIEQIKHINPNFDFGFTSSNEMLVLACQFNKLHFIKIIFEIIKKSNPSKLDVTDALMKAERAGSIEICKYILDQNFVQVDFCSDLFYNNVGSFKP